MNKFLLWHTLRKEFVQPYRNIVFDDNGIAESDLCTIHNYIGLDDINNNKIYEDSSIVEFKVNLRDDEHYGSYILNGIFKYDKKLCCYIIECIRFDRIFIYAISFKNISNIKIIDTLQENKLGLIKWKHYNYLENFKTELLHLNKKSQKQFKN